MKHNFLFLMTMMSAYAFQMLDASQIQILRTSNRVLDSLLIKSLKNPTLKPADVFQHVEALLKQRAGPNAKDEVGQSALILAIKKGYVNVVRLLIKNKVSLQGKDVEGKTIKELSACCSPYLRELIEEYQRFLNDLLLEVVNNNDAKWVNELLEQGADPDAQNSVGRTALILASSGGYEKIVQRLLEAKAFIDAQDEFGETALMSAARMGDADTVSTLLLNGANRHICNARFDGKTFSDYVKESTGAVQRVVREFESYLKSEECPEIEPSKAIAFTRVEIPDDKL